MSQSGVNKGRRRFLLGATSAIGAVGAVGIATPFVASWNPSAKAKAAGAPVKADISKLEDGSADDSLNGVVSLYGLSVVQNKVSLIYPSLNDQLADPASAVEQQPELCTKRISLD